MFPVRVALGFLLTSGAAVAQQYVISTVAGGVPPLTPVSGTATSIGQPTSIATDASGNVFFSSLNCVFKLDRNGVLARVAGNSRPGYSGDGGPAVNAQLRFSFISNSYDGGAGFGGIAVDSASNIYVADTGNNRVRKILTNGTITTIAGNGTAGYAGDGGAATDAQLYSPQGLAIDSSGNLYIADSGNNRVRKVLPSGAISTVVGNGTGGYSGDGGPAIAAQLLSPRSLAIDVSRNLYIAVNRFAVGDAEVVRRVSADGTITTVAGNGTYGFSGDGGPATKAEFANVLTIAVDGGGALYIADYNNARVRRVATDGTVTSVWGTGPGCFYVSSAGGTDINLNCPAGVALDASGQLYIAENNVHFILRVSTDGNIATVAGNGSDRASGDGGSGTSAQLYDPLGAAIDRAGNLFIADYANHRIRKVSPGGVITTVAGIGTPGFSGDGGPATSASLKSPSGVAVDASGNLYIADSSNSRVRKVLASSGIITTIGGTGVFGSSGDGGQATSAKLGWPFSPVLDASGNLYIADNQFHSVRRIGTDGIITTIAGSNSGGFSGDGGPATNARLSGPSSLALDSSGALYIADRVNNRIRRVSPSGIITTVAGNGTTNSLGDGGPAASAGLSVPSGVALDSAGNLYIADTGHYRVRKVSADGSINTIAGVGLSGYTGDGGPATNASLNAPFGVTVDTAGDIYVADSANDSIRLLQPSSTGGSISSVTNAASNLSGPIAPGEIVVIYGSGLGPAQIAQAHVGDNGTFGTQLAGTTVSFNGIPATVIYAWAPQVSAVVPYGITGAIAQVTVSYSGQTTATFSVPIASSAPGIFSLDSTGQGQAAAINQDGITINGAANPAKIGDIISLYATGEGQTTPAGVDGKPASAPLPQPNLPVSVTIGGQRVQFLPYLGGAPGAVAGLMQINVQIPAGIQTGNAVPVILQVGNVSSQAGVTIAVR